jgi:phosphatidate cytidylyltransferase
MLKTRVITAAIALILFFLIFVKADAAFVRLFFVSLVGISTFELTTMIFPALYSRFDPSGDRKPPVWLKVVTILLACGIYHANAFHSHYGLTFLVMGLLGGLLLGIFAAPTVELSIATSAGVVLSLVYGALPWVAIWELFRMAIDPRYVYLLCTVVWCGDTGAYFAGRTLGKHKLAPRMSPNKTWEGSVGGIIASLAGAAVVKYIYGDEIANWIVILAAALAGGVLGQLGDLAESTFKRFSGVKDSGKIFPGHGGFLDRVDGLLFAAPAIWAILYQFGG